jgi:hypothetical protein
MPNYDLRVNGSVRRVDSSDADKPLLYVLRGLGLTATKFGCGPPMRRLHRPRRWHGGAIPPDDCRDAQGKAITTLEGLSASGRIRSGRLHRTSGALMRLLHQRHDQSAAALLAKQQPRRTTLLGAW